MAGISEERLTQLVERFEQHEREEEEYRIFLFKAQENNTAAIAEITKNVAHVIEETRAIVQLHKDLQGTIRVGSALQRFMFWLLKWGTIGVAIIATLKWLVERFSHA